MAATGDLAGLLALLDEPSATAAPIEDGFRRLLKSVAAQKAAATRFG